MPAVVASVTLLCVAALIIVWARYCEVSREVDVVVRNTPPVGVDREWCDCELCAVARARLVALFNDTPKEN